MPFGKFRLSDPQGENLTCAAPMLPSRDLRKTAELYSALGFTTVLIPGGEGYLIARKEWVEIHFWPFPDLDPGRNYASVYIRVAAVDQAIAPFAALGPISAGCRFYPVESKPWGMRQGAFVDHDGNLLHIGQPVDHIRWGTPLSDNHPAQ
jgi:catechol 2,3-dioxygenase-like lactoylglutathione lyase family enzyme